MPESVTDSQFAIIDGYAYLFGGAQSNRILRADINNPANWAITNSTLPTTLAGANIAIIDGYIYLFGGLGGSTEAARNTIYSAPVTNPLAWTNRGNLLPEVVHKSSLAIVDGYIYMFGGDGYNHAREFIWRAPITNPLDWTDTGSTLPVQIYGSQIAIMNGNLYLLGGLFLPESPTQNIYSASLSNPLVWTLTGTLPYACCYGQFLTIGNEGFLYTQASVTVSQPYQTRIFRCQLSTPNTWIDTNAVIPGDLTQSQFGIIYDRIFAFGGNGISQVFCCNQTIKFIPSTIKAVNYGQVTRTNYDVISNPFLKTQLLGFPYWKTDYDT